MRHWEKKPDKPSVRAVIDRRQLILGMLTLLGMAVLLIVGLTPRSASAPQTEPEAAQAGGDAALRLNAECQVVQRMAYAPYGHELTRRQTLPSELAGKTRADLEAAYDLWQVTSFSPGEVTMERTLDLYCPEHYVLLPDDSGMLCVFQNRYGDALALVKELNVSLTELPDAYQEELRPGKGFDTLDALTQWLESIES